MLNLDPAGDDDAEAIRGFMLNLGGNFRRFFAMLERASAAGDGGGGEGDGDGDGDAASARYRVAAILQHTFITASLRRAAQLPSYIFINAATNDVNTRIPAIVKKLLYLVETGGVVNPDATSVSWRDSVLRLTDELSEEMSTAELRFCFVARLQRAMLETNSPAFWTLAVCGGAATVALSGISVLAVLGGIDIVVGLVTAIIAGVTATLAFATIVHFFFRASSLLRRLEAEQWNHVIAGLSEELGEATSPDGGRNTPSAFSSLQRADDSVIDQPQMAMFPVMVNPLITQQQRAGNFSNGNRSTGVPRVAFPPAQVQVFPGMFGSSRSLASSDRESSVEQQQPNPAVPGLLSSVPVLEGKGASPLHLPQRSSVAFGDGGGHGDSEAEARAQERHEGKAAQERQRQHIAGSSSDHQAKRSQEAQSVMVLQHAPRGGEAAKRAAPNGNHQNHNRNDHRTATNGTTTTTIRAPLAATLSDTIEPKLSIHVGQRSLSLSGKHIAEVVIMVGYDADLNVTYWNYAAEMGTGFLGSDVIGRPIEDMMYEGLSGSEGLRKRLSAINDSSSVMEPFRVHFNALATPAFPMMCQDVPLLDETNRRAARMLLCVPEKDTLREQRFYLLAFRSQIVRAHLASTSNALPPSLTASLHTESATTPTSKVFGPSLSSATHKMQQSCLLRFLAITDAPHIIAMAQLMEATWDWTTPTRMLSRALKQFIDRCEFNVAPQTAPHIRIDTAVVIDIVFGVVSGMPEGFKCTVCVSTETFGKVCAFVVSLSASPFSSGKEITATGSGEIELSDLFPEYWAVRCIDAGGFVSISPSARRRSTSQPSSESGKRPSISAEYPTLTLSFPCQVTHLDFEDELLEAVDADAKGESVGMHESTSALMSAINTQVIVLTLVSDTITKHNLSTMLMRIPFVSVTALVSIGDLIRMSESHRVADVIMVDEDHYSRALAAFSRKGQQDHQLAASAGVKKPKTGQLPVLVLVGAVRANVEYCVATPISRADLKAIMWRVGSMVSRIHQEAAAAEEQERVLQSRQDSPWTQGKLLGRGAYGAVYEATSDLTGGKMAVKKFYYKEGDEIDALINEIRIMCQLQHPNIVHYFHCERKDDGVNLFMELCDGSLLDVIKNKKRLNAPFVIHQVASAISYLHECGIVHRDIKPGNVLTKSEVVKLTDFGTARKTTTGQLEGVHGSFKYMAPEVYRGDSHNSSCDIWSIGALTCELEGKLPPFMEPRCIDMLATMATVDLPRGLEGDCRDFVRLCLQLDPSARPSANMLLLHPYLVNRTSSLHAAVGHDRRYSTAPTHRDHYAESLFSLDSDVVDADMIEAGSPGAKAKRQTEEAIGTLFSVM